MNPYIKTSLLFMCFVSFLSLMAENALNGGKPYPPGFQPKRDVRSVLDFDPPPVPDKPETKASTLEQ